MDSSSDLSDAPDSDPTSSSDESGDATYHPPDAAPKAKRQKTRHTRQSTASSSRPTRPRRKIKKSTSECEKGKGKAAPKPKPRSKPKSKPRGTKRKERCDEDDDDDEDDSVDDVNDETDQEQDQDVELADLEYDSTSESSYEGEDPIKPPWDRKCNGNCKGFNRGGEFWCGQAG